MFGTFVTEVFSEELQEEFGNIFKYIQASSYGINIVFKNDNEISISHTLLSIRVKIFELDKNLITKTMIDIDDNAENVIQKLVLNFINDYIDNNKL